MYTPIKTARIILLYLALVFGLAILFYSCTIQRGCPGAGRENGYVGYDGGNHYKTVKGGKRTSY